jgi:hypothetical protein
MATSDSDQIAVVPRCSYIDDTTGGLTLEDGLVGELTMEVNSVWRRDKQTVFR